LGIILKGDALPAYRLLVVSHAVDIGGAERGIIRKLGSINRDLFEPSYACPFEGPMTSEMRKLGIKVYLGHPSRRLLNIRRSSLGASGLGVLLYPFAFAASVLRLALLIRKERFDLVLADSAKADIYGTLAGRLARRPVVWHIHDIFCEPTFSSLNLRALKVCARRFTTRIISISEATKAAMVALGVPPEKIQTVYNGIDMQMAQETQDPTEVRKELGIEAEAPLAGMVGRLVDWKGPDYFIRAAAQVTGSVPEARFLLVGDAVFGEKQYVDYLKDLCRELGLEDRVAFTGFREDVLDIMSALDVVVHASVQPEPFGQVLLEAMAEGRPVVATTGGGVSEIVDDEVTGLLVPPRDSQAMAEAITAILLDKDRARRMGAAGLRKVQQSFTVDLMARGIEAEMLKAMRGS
jgi:glycosyltransferase involved in cell wall biosynthesis